MRDIYARFLLTICAMYTCVNFQPRFTYTYIHIHIYMHPCVMFMHVSYLACFDSASVRCPRTGDVKIGSELRGVYVWTCVYSEQVYACMYVHICTCTSVCVHVCTYMYVYECMRACMYVRMHVYLYCKRTYIFMVGFPTQAKTQSQWQLPCVWYDGKKCG
jgi:hypothetical protein